jgi:hypothetical protein
MNDNVAKPLDQPNWFDVLLKLLERIGVRLQRENESERSRARDPQKAFQAIARLLYEHLTFLGEGINHFSRDMERVSCSKLLMGQRLPEE